MKHLIFFLLATGAFACSTATIPDESTSSDDALSGAGPDVFSSTSCAGATLTDSDAERWLGTNDTADVGSFTIASRSRTCAEAGCTPWRTRNDLPFALVERRGIEESRSGDVIVLPPHGVVRVWRSEGAMHLGLVEAPVGGLNGTVTFEAELGGSFSAAPATYGMWSHWETHETSLKSVVWGVDAFRTAPQDNFSIPATGVSSTNFGPRRTLDAQITDHCVRIAAAGRDLSEDTQLVFYAWFTPPPAP